MSHFKPFSNHSNAKGPQQALRLWLKIWVPLKSLNALNILKDFERFKEQLNLGPCLVVFQLVQRSAKLRLISPPSAKARKTSPRIQEISDPGVALIPRYTKFT